MHQSQVGSSCFFPHLSPQYCTQQRFLSRGRCSSSRWLTIFAHVRCTELGAGKLLSTLSPPARHRPVQGSVPAKARAANFRIQVKFTATCTGRVAAGHARPRSGALWAASGEWEVYPGGSQRAGGCRAGLGQKKTSWSMICHSH